MIKSNALSRRNLFHIASAGGIGLAMPLLAKAQGGGAPPAEVAAGDIARSAYPFKLGAFSVTIINDGGRVVENPQSKYAVDQSIEAVSAVMRENLLPEVKYFDGRSPVLLDTGARRVLFDCGFGSGGPGGGGRLHAVMALQGYKPEDIDIVAVTHMHPDHITGLVTEGKPTFPNARIVVSRLEHDYWTGKGAVSPPADRAEGTKRIVALLADRLTLIQNGDRPCDGVTAILTAGHTPGHMIYRIESQGTPLYIIGDLCPHFVISMQHPEWRSAYDMDQAKAADVREEIFARLASERAAFVGYHNPFPAVGFAEKREQGYRFVPASYQFQV